ncbi:hypothetical protein CRG98_005469 [Punica granatum]|uniref:Uncharacterized protein n=1 Tax=Punica granatum TaxID=22663 RepID=A0A2I0L0P3_PUNGR|nr:hypothetical protein CRG98_005469 [Punica granatum]
MRPPWTRVVRRSPRPHPLKGGLSGKGRPIKPRKNQEDPRIPSLGLGRGFPWFDRGLDVSPTSILTPSRHASLSRRGMLPSVDVRGKESGKRREGQVTRLDVVGDGHPRAAAAAAAAWRK